MPMTKREQLLRIRDEYRADHNNAPATAREMADWAVDEGKYRLHHAAANRKCAEELAEAMRLDLFTSGGRRIRAMHSFTKDKQVGLWDHIRTISPDNMAVSVALRRNGVVGEVKQIKCDLDFFNEIHPDLPPLQTSFNFEGDLADAGLISPSSIELERLIGQPPPVPPEKA
jgi:hypothetical protein